MVVNTGTEGRRTKFRKDGRRLAAESLMSRRALKPKDCKVKWSRRKQDVQRYPKFIPD